MKSQNIAFLFVSCATALAATASAGNVNVSVSAGSVAGIDTTAGGSGTSWSGLSGSASTAIISYQTDPTLAAAGNMSGSTSEFKFSNASGSPQGYTFTGVNSNGSTVTGSSTVSTPTNGAPAYYQAAWTASSTSTSTGPVAGSGTYDPWIVTNNDLKKLGTTANGTANLYYQTSLLAYPNSTGFNLSPGQSGSYDFRIGVTRGTGAMTFLDVVVSETYGSPATIATTFNDSRSSGFYLYLLGSNANNSGADPYARINANDAQLITSTAQVSRIFASDLNPDGSPSATLSFGLVDYGQHMTSDPSGQILSWTSTTSQMSIQATPEPAPMAALALGVLALGRRRRAAPKA